MSAALMAMAFHSLGVPAISLNAFQVAMHTNSIYGNAKIKRIDKDRISRELDMRKIIIMVLAALCLTLQPLSAQKKEGNDNFKYHKATEILDK